MKVTIEGEVFEFDPARKPMSEALAIENGLKIPYAQYEEGLREGRALAAAGFIWLVWRRNGRDVPLADILSGAVDLDLNTLEIEAEEGEADPYDAAPASFEYDRRRYVGVFAEVLGIRPWEIPLLEQGEFEVLIDYLEDKGGG